LGEQPSLILVAVLDLEGVPRLGVSLVLLVLGVCGLVLEVGFSRLANTLKTPFGVRKRNPYDLFLLLAVGFGLVLIVILVLVVVAVVLRYEPN